MTDCCDESAWLDEEIAAQKALITSVRAAITALAAGAQQYSLDTGQTRQMVTKANIASLRILLSAARAELATLMQRRTGCATVQVRPAW